MKEAYFCSRFGKMVHYLNGDHYVASKTQLLITEKLLKKRTLKSEIPCLTFQKRKGKKISSHQSIFQKLTLCYPFFFFAEFLLPLDSN